MRKKDKILFVCLVVILIGLIYVAFNPKNLTTDNILPNTNSNTEETIDITKYYVLVTNFTNLENDISSEDLKTRTIYTDNSNVNAFTELENLGFKFEYTNIEDLEKQISNGNFALLDPQIVKWQYKTVFVDGINPWSKNFDIEKYTLKSVQKTLRSSYLDSTSTDNKLTIFVSGEIIPVRAVDRYSLHKNNNYTYLYDFFRKDIENADLAIGLLENPLNGDPTPCTGCMIFVGDERNAKGMADVGFDIISVAANHAGDNGQKGYERTQISLTEAGLNIAGTGKGIDAQMKPAIKDINGIRFGVVGGDDVAHYYWNSSDKSYGLNGFSKIVNGTSQIDMAKVRMLSGIKERYEIDFLIVYMSWGVEYRSKNTAKQQEMAQAFIDEGDVDLVLGSHPHWVENIESYDNTPIFYSFGNFIFDQTHTLETRQGLVSNIYLYNNEIKFIELMPHQICGYHQTKNDLTNQYLRGELTLDEVYNKVDSNGCVYWMPKKLKSTDKSYTQILNRIFANTKI